jgi:hypothetical protein
MTPKIKSDVGNLYVPKKCCKVLLLSKKGEILYLVKNERMYMKLMVSVVKATGGKQNVSGV